MGYFGLELKLGLAALGAVCLLAAVPQGGAKAMDAQLLAHRGVPSPVLLDIAQEGARFHHGKRTQAEYCYPKNRWWFYRPYTTGQDGHPRCMPYFHYLDAPQGRRGARADRYIK